MYFIRCGRFFCFNAAYQKHCCNWWNEKRLSHKKLKISFLLFFLFSAALFILSNVHSISGFEASPALKTLITRTLKSKFSSQGYCK